MFITDKVVDIENISATIESIRSSGKSIVTTNGCFDIIHIGHIASLQTAKSYGDILIVGVNSDASAKRLKGESRPINNELSRVAVLAAMSFVDYVFLFEEDTPEKSLEIIRPDIHTKSGDYKAADLPEKDIVEKYGGKVIITDYFVGESTTNTIEKCRNLK